MLFRSLSTHNWERVIRQSWQPFLQSAAVVAAAAAAGCVGTARADEVATIHPEAKVCSPSTPRFVDTAIVNKPSFAWCVVTCCSLGKFYHCPQGNGRSSSMKSGSEISVGLTRSLNTLQPRQKKTVQGLFHLAHLAEQRSTLP